MDARRLERLRRQLDSRLPLLGGWLRRRALRALAAEPSSDTTRALLAAFRRCTDATWGCRLLAELGALQLPSCRDAVAAAWAGSRSAALLELLAAWGHVPQGPPDVRVLAALRLGRPEIVLAGGAELVEPLLAACADADAELAAAARTCLLRLTDPATLDRLAADWAVTRDDLLLQALTAADYLPARPVATRTLLALKRNQIGTAVEGGEAVVEPLLHACAGPDPDPEIAARAAEALRRLPDAAAREALCRRAIDEGHPTALEAARAAGYAPAEPGRRALLYFLTGQWDAYEALDFDRALLRAAYAAASPPLRRRVLEQARRSGRVDLAEALFAGPPPARLGRMSGGEWKALIETLTRGAAWDRLWSLAREAPPGRAAVILRRLRASDWTPGGLERRCYEELCDLARGWEPAALGPGGYLRAVLDTGDGPVRALATSADGRWLAAASGDGVLQLWALPDGVARSGPAATEETIECLAFDPDSGTLAGGSREGRVYVWRRSDGDRLRTLDGCTGPVTGLTYTPDGQTLVALTRDAVQIWDLTADEPEAKLRELEGGLTCCAISPDGEVLATGSDDGTVWLSWHLPDGQLQDALRGHTSAVRDLAFGADGRTLVSAARDGGVRLWNVADGRDLGELRRDPIPHGSPDFRPDPWPHRDQRGRSPAYLGKGPGGKAVLAEAQGHTVRLWTPEDGRTRKTLDGHAGHVTCLAACPVTGILAAGGEDGTVCLWGLPARLGRLARQPVAAMRLADWDRVRHRLARPRLPAAERGNLLFLNALLKLRFKNDVQLGEPAPHVPAGAHDISLED